MLAAAVAATERAVYEGAAVARAAVPSEVSAGGEGGRDGGEGTRERRWREEAWVVGGGMSLFHVRTHVKIHTTRIRIQSPEEKTIQTLKRGPKGRHMQAENRETVYKRRSARPKLFHIHV